MNYIIKYGENFVAISDSVEASPHKHWLLQMFISDKKELNIEVNGQLIVCNALIVNMDTQHAFSTDGEVYFTILIDPTTELGRVMRCLLMDQPFYVFSHEETIVMQQTIENALEKKDFDTLLSFIQKSTFQLTFNNIINFNERIVKVLNLLDDCTHEDEIHQIEYFSTKVYLSESRIAHLFKKETGIPLKSYIVLHKLQKSYDLIFNGENITTAALNAGFDSS